MAYLSRRYFGVVASVSAGSGMFVSPSVYRWVQGWTRWRIASTVGWVVCREQEGMPRKVRQVDSVRFAWEFLRLQCGDPESDANDRIAVACHCQIASQESQRCSQRLRNQHPVEWIGMQRG